MKKILLFFTLLGIVFIFVACDVNTTTTNQNNTDNLIEFTLDELAQYDGLEGRNAYIAVDGYVYDVSDSTYWRDGLHQGTVQAGQDLTVEIDTISPHGRSVLDNIPVIGVLEQE